MFVIALDQVSAGFSSNTLRAYSVELSCSLTLDLHRLIAAGNRTVTASGNDYFSSAFLTDVSLSNRICHCVYLLIVRSLSDQDR